MLDWWNHGELKESERDFNQPIDTSRRRMASMGLSKMENPGAIIDCGFKSTSAALQFVRVPLVVGFQLLQDAHA